MDDETLMARAVRNAGAVRSRTSPNPWVGAVLVTGDGRSFDGATEPPGGRHADSVIAARGVGERTRAWAELTVGGHQRYVASDPAAAAPVAVDPEKEAKKAASEAAIARAKAQREAAQPKNTEAVTFEQAHETAEIDARREAVALTPPPTPPS